MYNIGDIIILNEKVAQDLPMRVGQRAIILGKSTFVNQDYDVEFDDSEVIPVKSSELNKLTQEDKQFMDYIFTGNTVIWNEETVQIIKVDYLHRNAEIKFNDDSEVVVSFDGLKPFDYRGINRIEELQFDIYDDLLNVFVGHYKNTDNTYTVPKEFLVSLIKKIYTGGA
jgi:hypothetical protein